MSSEMDRYLQASTLLFLLEIYFSLATIVTNHWIQWFAWQKCTSSLSINNKTHCFHLCVFFFPLLPFFFFSFFFSEELQARRNNFYWIFWVTCHIWLPSSMLAIVDVSSHTVQNCHDKMTHFNISLEKASSPWSKQSRNFSFQWRSNL